MNSSDYPSCTGVPENIVTCFPTRSTILNQGQSSRFIWNPTNPVLSLTGAIDLYLLYEDTQNVVWEQQNITTALGSVEYKVDDKWFQNSSSTPWHLTDGMSLMWTYVFVALPSGQPLSSDSPRQAIFSAVQTSPVQAVPMTQAPSTPSILSTQPAVTQPAATQAQTQAPAQTITVGAGGSAQTGNDSSTTVISKGPSNNWAIPVTAVLASLLGSLLLLTIVMAIYLCCTRRHKRSRDDRDETFDGPRGSSMRPPYSYSLNGRPASLRESETVRPILHRETRTSGVPQRESQHVSYEPLGPVIHRESSGHQRWSEDAARSLSMVGQRPPEWGHYNDRTSQDLEGPGESSRKQYLDWKQASDKRLSTRPKHASDKRPIVNETLPEDATHRRHDSRPLAQRVDPRLSYMWGGQPRGSYQTVYIPVAVGGDPHSPQYPSRRYDAYSGLPYPGETDESDPLDSDPRESSGETREDASERTSDSHDFTHSNSDESRSGGPAAGAPQGPIDDSPTGHIDDDYSDASDGNTRGSHHHHYDAREPFSQHDASLVAKAYTQALHNPSFSPKYSPENTPEAAQNDSTTILSHLNPAWTNAEPVVPEARFARTPVRHESRSARNTHPVVSLPGQPTADSDSASIHNGSSVSEEVSSGKNAQETQNVPVPPKAPTRRHPSQILLGSRFLQRDSYREALHEDDTDMSQRSTSFTEGTSYTPSKNLSSSSIYARDESVMEEANSRNPYRASLPAHKLGDTEAVPRVSDTGHNPAEGQMPYRAITPHPLALQSLKAQPPQGGKEDMLYPIQETSASASTRYSGTSANVNPSP